MKRKEAFFILALLFYSSVINKTLSQDTQWSSFLIAYSSEYDIKKYSARQVLGKPSVMPGFGISPAAWMPAGQTGSEEWVHVGFGMPDFISRISIAENFNPGTVSKIILFDSLDKQYTVYESEPHEKPLQTGRMLNLTINKTSYRVFSLMLYLNTKYVDNCQIDAIGVSGTNKPEEYRINVIKEAKLTSKPQNLGANVNSNMYELAPVISIDGRTLFFTREGHPENTGSDKKQDVWYSVMDSTGAFTQAVNIGSPINNPHRNFAFSLTPDGSSLLLGNVYNADGTMGKGVSNSFYKNGKWSFPEQIKIKNFYNLSNSSAYFLAGNRKILLMSIEREDSYGGLDIYASILDDTGNWSEPFNLGPDINTAADEVSPFLAADNITLYYSTSGFPGYGNYDMFLTRRNGDSWMSWSEPVNIGPEINTSGGETYFNIPASGDYAYFISNKNSYGLDDIFRVLLPEALKPKPVALVSGKVLNRKTDAFLEACISYEVLPSSQEAGNAVSSASDGEYKIVLPAGYMYGFYAETPGFASVHENLDLRNITKYTEIRKDLYLVPIEKGQSVNLNNIFFEFGKAELLEESFSELDRIADLLIANPEVEIEVVGHTDSVGTEENNKILSGLRAAAVYNYFISKGIPKVRLEMSALGEAKPEAPNDNEENMKKNRRVELIILKK